MTPDEHERVRDMVAAAELYLKKTLWLPDDGQIGLRMARTNWFGAAVLTEAYDNISQDAGEGPIEITVMLNPGGIVAEDVARWYLIRRSVEEAKLIKQVQWGPNERYTVRRWTYNMGFFSDPYWMADFQMGPFRMLYRTDNGTDAMRRYQAYRALADDLTRNRLPRK